MNGSFQKYQILTAAQLNGWVSQFGTSVKDFGALGNSGTDDTLAIQAAIDAAQPGDVVYFPPGGYQLTAPLRLRPGVTLRANDAVHTYLLPLTPGMECLTYDVDISGPTVNSFTVSGLGFQMGLTTGAFGVGIHSESTTVRASIIRIDNCYFSGGEVGIYLKNCVNIEINRCFYNTTNVGIFLRVCADVDIVGGKAQNGANYAIIVEGAPGPSDEGVRVLGFSSNGQAGGIKVTDQDWGMLTGCSFTSTTKDPGSFINNAIAWKISNCEFSGNASTTPALTLLNCAECIINASYLVLGNVGLSIQGLNNVVSNNVFNGNVAYDLLNRSSSTIVVGNVFCSPVPANSVLEEATVSFVNMSANTSDKPLQLLGTSRENTGLNNVF